MALALVAAGIAGGCSDPAPSGPESAAAVPAGAISAAAQPLRQADGDSLRIAGLSGPVERERRVINDDATWARYWTLLTRDFGGGGEPLPRPVVDFTREQVIVAAMGQRPNGGYDILITRVADVGATRYVAVRELSPGPRCYTTQARTTPVALVRVPRATSAAQGGGRVVFVEETAINSCG